MKKYKAHVTYEYKTGTFIYYGLGRLSNSIYLSTDTENYLILNYLDCVDLIKEFEEQANKHKMYNKKIVKIEVIEV